MQVFVFDIMGWPGGDRTLHPLPGRLYDRDAGRDFYHDHLRYYTRADELGFDGVCFAEHHYGPLGMCPSPNVMAAAVAARTSRTKLVMMGNCLSIHHPVRLAEELALVDNLSNGRLVVGCIRGSFLEHWAYNVPADESRGRFEETYELMHRAWTEDEPFPWHGRYFDFDTVSILPRPIQRPHPPLIVAGNTPDTVEFAARQRLPLAVSFGPTEVLAQTLDYYREYAQRECGWTPGLEHCLLSRQVYVSTTNAKAREECEGHVMSFYAESPVMRRYEGKLEEMRQAFQVTRTFDYQRRVHHTPTQREAPSYEGYQRDGFCIVGDPDHVIAQVREQQQILKVGTLMTYVPFGTMRVPEAMKSIELFANEVLPHLRDDSGVLAPAENGSIAGKADGAAVPIGDAS
jgi:alkanesulfonate monooxygenase SsuD/methylene tetrahydromethanopterin reductase-like flavin-dependent oxidoreductase (luciferase family)